MHLEYLKIFNSTISPTLLNTSGPTRLVSSSPSSEASYVSFPLSSAPVPLKTPSSALAPSTVLNIIPPTTSSSKSSNSTLSQILLLNTETPTSLEFSVSYC